MMSRQKPRPRCFTGALALLPLTLLACDGQALFKIESGSPNETAPRVPVGRVTLHRLNRVELDNTVRDLLGESQLASPELPAEDTQQGFDNNADALTISPVIVEKYEQLASSWVDRALARDGVPGLPRIITCRPPAVPTSTCVDDILSRFAKRAWRTPVTQEEIGPYVALVHAALEAGDAFDQAIGHALKGVLLSRLYFRVE